MKIKLGIIGLGMAFDKLHYPALKRLTDKYEIIALADIDPTKLIMTAKALGLPKESIYGDYKEMLRREDLNTILTLVPIKDNYIIAKDVMLSGKNLIAEKPFAAKIEEAEELIKLKNEKNLKVMVAENFRYEECFKKIKDIINKNELGAVRYFILYTGADFEKEMITDAFAAKEWRQHPAFSGGIFLDGGIHDMAMMRYLFGEMEHVSAIGKKHDKEYCAYQSINALIKFPENISGNYIYVSDSCEKHKTPIGLRIFFQNGELYLKNKEYGKIYLFFNNGQKKKVCYKKDEGYFNELLNFYEGNNILTPEKELGDLKMIYNILNELEKN